MIAAVWAPLVSALDAWQSAGRIAQFWLRDDDAVAPSAPLAQFLDMTSRHRVPSTLAVIPENAGDALRDRLVGRADIDVALHGWSHANHAPPDKKKQELGLHRGREVVLAELSEGHRRLGQLFGDHYVSVLVPPWNRIDASLIDALPGIGIAALSVFGKEKAGPLPVINTHVDIMDWHGTRGGRPAADVVADAVRRLGEMEETGGSLGLLTHHLVHDDAAWSLIEDFLAVTSAHPACRWVALRDLVPGRA
jgi:peptidoglycan/xylan/chitin deacetylase (PgdA/CDA1 family)